MTKRKRKIDKIDDAILDVMDFYNRILRFTFPAFLIRISGHDNGRRQYENNFKLTHYTFSGDIVWQFESSMVMRF